MKRRLLTQVLATFLLVSMLITPAYAISAESISHMAPLFEKAKGDYYNYAPCLIQLDNSTKYLFYCGNRESSTIVDYICWKKATLNNGVWTWSSENVAFGPSESDWDMCHVCDPDVIKGQFDYNGHTYSWAMTYLGVAQWDCNANQIGIAFSDSIEGPWVRFEGNPVILAANTTSWGTGQDSMISLDQAGRFRIVYRYSDGTDDYCYYQDFDFSDANNYTKTTPVMVTRSGLTDGISHTCSSHVAYDPVRQMYYMAAEHIWDEAKRSCRETLISALDKVNFENGTGTWEIIYRYNEGTTGYASNHNSSIVRDEYGMITESNVLAVAMSSSDSSGLWSFKINEGQLALSDINNRVSLTTGHAYKFINKATGLVLDNWDSGNGNPCYAYEWTGVHNQQWVATSLGGNNYKLINRWTGKALDNYENSTPEVVYIWDDVFGLDQHWEITKVSGDYCKIKNIKTNRSLTATANTNVSAIIATPYNGSDHQLWEIVDLGPAETLASIIESGSTYKLVNKATGDVLDNWNSGNGTVCYSYIWSGVDNQMWTITDVGAGEYKLLNKWTSKALDSYDAVNGASVYVWDYVGGVDQKWQIVSCSDGYFKLVNAKTGKVITQSVQGNGNAIFCWNDIDIDTQKWGIVKVS